MKMMKSVLIIAMATSAVAQSPSTVTKVKSQLTGPTPAAASGSTVSMAGKPAAAVKPPVASSKPAAQLSTAKPAATSAKAGPKPVASTKTPAAAKTSKAPTGTPKAVVQADNKEKRSRRYGSEGRRDPFVSPVVERASGGTSGCSSGKKCLVADQIALKGIIRTTGSNIAVVVTVDNRAYFLHENDPIYNGVVTKISESSVTFRENGKDVLGKPTTREVVKKINTQV